MPRGHVFPDRLRLATLRGEAGLTQLDLARLAGFGLRTINKIEAGKPTSAFTLDAVATVLANRLGRAVSLRDLLVSQQQAASSELVIAEQVKLLDLRGDGGVELIDNIRFRQIPASQSDVTFHYATQGENLRGRSLSHPSRTEKRPIGEDRETSPHLRVALTMHVEVQRHTQEPIEIQNLVEYLDGFQSASREWCHTHVVHPTESLSLLVEFPTRRPCRRAAGLLQRHPAEEPFLIPEQPVVFGEGRTVHWHLATPRPGETYCIEWDW